MPMRAAAIGILAALLLPARPAAADATAPAEIWASACTYCHDRGVAPPLFGRNLDAALIAAAVRNGLDSMPAFHPSEISDEALAQLAAWVARQPAAAPPTPPAPAAPAH
ncbi:MAG TPA: cytochrome c [Steroidobacteraceae bacterium]|jgi:cytochrome c553|nr:cytochrome c [Steroidobacteraceae bacterium]